MKVKILSNRPASSLVRNLFAQQARGHAPSIAVRRQQIPYWQTQNWTFDGQNYSGSYQTEHGAFTGWIHQRSRQEFDFYIYDPPQELRRHSHWSCFQERDSGWYAVHMASRPADVSSGIMTIERLITQAFES